MKYFTEKTDAVLKDLNVNLETGLSDAEVALRQEKYGKNALPEKKGKSLFMMFLSQLNDWLIYILLVAIIITASMGHFTDAIIISMVIIVNAVLGVTQEYKA